MFDGIPPSLISNSSRYGELKLPDGMKMRYAALYPATPAKATALVTFGKSSYIEKFPALVRGWLNRGFNVYIPELPGHGLSDRYIQKEKKRRRNYVPSVEHQISSLNFFYEKVVEEEQSGSKVIYGHSAAAHTQLRWVNEYPKEDVKAAIWEAPMFKYTVPDLAHEIQRVFSKIAGQEPSPSRRIEMPRYGMVALSIANAIGFGKCYAPGEKDYDPDRLDFDGNAYTSNPKFFENNIQRLKKEPDKASDGVTIRWLVATQKSIQHTLEPGYLDRLNMPVLVLSGDQDRITPPRLNGPIAELMGAQHEILRGARHDMPGEPRPIRQEKWRHVERFLEERHVLH